MVKPPEKGSTKSTERKMVVENRRARHDFAILEELEAGIVLEGTEVKSLRAGGGNLSDAYVMIRNGEAQLHGMHIAHYRFGNINNHEPERTRILLLHRREIERLDVQVSRKGNTIVPLSIYLLGGRFKVGIAVARGKNVVDKRHDIAKRDVQRDVQRQLRDAQR